MGADIDTARRRAVLSRIRMLRKQRETQLARVVLEWADSSWGSIEPETPANDSPAALLREHARVERAYLLMRQLDGTGYGDALKTLESVENSVLGKLHNVSRSSVRLVNLKPAPSLTGIRKYRVLSSVATAYSTCGDERAADRVIESVLGRPFPATPEGADEIVRRLGKLRSADLFSDHATRLTRRAYVDLLGATPDSFAQAADLLARARVAADISSGLRETKAGVLLARTVSARVTMESVALEPDRDRRVDMLTSLVTETKSILAESTASPYIFPVTVMLRQSLHGEVMIELARYLRGHERPDTARLGRVCVAPRLTVNEIDADYKPAVSICYADACAMSGEQERARTVWERTRRQMARARPNADLALAALDRRLTHGLPDTD